MAINFANPAQTVKVVFPTDLGKGIKKNDVAKKFEVDLTDFVDGNTTSLSPTGQIVAKQYDDAEVKGRLTTLESKTDKFVTEIVPTREGNTVKLTYNFSDGSSQFATFEDKDTIAIAFDPTAIHNRLDALERKPDNDTKPTGLTFAKDTNILTVALSDGTNKTVDLTPQVTEVPTVKFVNAWDDELVTVVKGA